MSLPVIILFCSVVGFAPTALLVGPVRRLAFWIGAVDQPDHVRKLHTRPTARLGGIAILGGLVVAVAVQLYYPEYRQILTRTGLNGDFLAGLAVASVVIIGLGAVDDVVGVRPRTKLMVQVLAACLLVYLVDDLRVRKLVGIPLHSLEVPVTILWLVACTNAVNLIDGLDGLAAGVTLIASVTVLIFAAILGNWFVVILTSTLCGALFGFLIYNWPPAVIFLGDSGSLFLGFLIGAISIKGSLKSHAAFAFVAAILPLGLPMMDTVFAAARRWAVGLPASRADREHIHHRLRDWGFSHRQILIFLYTICVIFGLLALMVNLLRDQWATALVLVLLGAAILFSARVLWGSQAIFLSRRLRELVQIRGLVRERRRPMAALARKLEKASSLEEIADALRESGGALGIRRFELVPAAAEAAGASLAWEDAAPEEATRESRAAECGSRHELPVRRGERLYGSLEVAFRYAHENLAAIVAGNAQEIAEQVAQAMERIEGVAGAVREGQQDEFEPAAAGAKEAAGIEGAFPTGLVVAALACGGGFALLYARVFGRLAGRWISDGNYSHGFLVPVIAAAFIYVKRRELSTMVVRPSWLGWAVIACGLGAYLAGVLGTVFYLQALSILVVLAGAALALAGRRALVFFGFAIFYLVLMIPLPDQVYAALTFKLQLLATRASAAVLDLAGAPVYADANNIRFAGGKTLAIAEACSGLRSILGLTATGLAFVYFLKREPIWERVLLVVSTLGIAILTNILRISGTGLLYHYVSPQSAEGFFHGLSGWLVFMLGLLLLMIEYRIISGLFVDEGSGAPRGEAAVG